jgi:hypothetical protein
MVGVAQMAFADPPYRVARISDVSGAVSYRAASADEWSVAIRNYPLTVGDDLWTDRSGRVELALGSSFVRLGPSTAFSVLNLDDQRVQLRITQGALVVRVRDLTDDAVEIDTPVGAITLDQPGSYRIDVDEADGHTTTTVRNGRAEMATNGAVYTMDASHSVVVGESPAAYTLASARSVDDFENWCVARDRRVDSSASLKYVSARTIGYEDLDDYGSWRDAPGYGQAWYPRAGADWAPYRFGHWAWVDPWGWSWIDDQPWGFASSHYGRWMHASDGWGWVPGNVGVRPVYAPALVAFVGGAGWTASFGLGTAPVAWFPLAPREAYVPSYGASPGYLRAVNAPSVDINARVNAANVRYANRDVPGAFTAVSRDAFGRGRPVNTAVVPVPREVMMKAAPATGGPGRPSASEVVGGNRRGIAAPATAVSRRVIVKQEPPANSRVAVQSIPRLNAPARSAPVRLAPSPQRGQPAQERASPAGRTTQQERAAPTPRQAPQERAAPAPRSTPQEHVAPAPQEPQHERTAPQEHAAPPPHQEPKERAVPREPRHEPVPPKERAAPPQRGSPPAHAAPTPKGRGDDSHKKDGDKK